MTTRKAACVIAAYLASMVLIFAGPAAVAEKGKLREVVAESTVTNDWDVAIKLCTAGETLDGYSSMYWSTTNCISFGTIMACTNYAYIGWSHKCPDCSKDHFDNYPKSNDVFQAVQKKINTTIYRGDRELVKTVKYEHPTKKITITTVQTAGIKTNISTSIKSVEMNVKTNITTENIFVEKK